MRYILPSMTWLVFASVGMLAAQDDPRRTPSGNELMEHAVQAFVNHPSLEVKFSQRATLFGQRVSGAGYFLQLRDGERLLVRYEFKMQAGDQERSILHVSDGKTLWIRRDVGELKTQAYVNLHRLRQLRAVHPSAPGPTTDFPSALALGGVNELLNNIAINFDFGEPAVVELRGMAMWEIVGNWKPSRLAQFASGSPSKQALPAHLPDTVRLFLSQDQRFPLFPYRIMFGRSRNLSAGNPTSSSQIIDPLVTIDLNEVGRRPDLTPADFAFLPSDENVDDLTDIYADRLGFSR